MRKLLTKGREGGEAGERVRKGRGREFSREVKPSID